MRGLRVAALAVLVASCALAGGAAGGGADRPDGLLVTLELDVTVRRGDAVVTLAGTFRNRVAPAARNQRLLAVGTAVTTHRHGAARPQRGRIASVLLDARSDADLLRLSASGPLTGGPALTSPRGTCRRFLFRIRLLPRGSSSASWRCDVEAHDHPRPVHRDAFGSGATFTSSYTITRQG